MHDLVDALKALGEPSRLRILTILEHHELSVTELVLILGQSQPRVSRHLRVLGDAGAVRRHAEGTSALFRLERQGETGRLVEAVLALVERNEEQFRHDARRLEAVVAARRGQADDYFRRHAANWDQIRQRHVPEHDIENAIVELLVEHGVEDLLDLGTGTGRMLEIAGPKVHRGIGIDLSRAMLTIARDRLEHASLHHCEVRLGDIAALDVATSSVDAAVLHHVLHFLDRPADVIAEAARTLRPGGIIVVVDFAPHNLAHLRDEFAHRRLGFSDDEMTRWLSDAGLGEVTARPFVANPAIETDETLTVTIWTAVQRVEEFVTYDLEVAS